MYKSDEIEHSESCWNKAKDDTMVFVLIDTDPAAPDTVRDWIRRRIEIGLNHPDDSKMQTAEIVAQTMEAKLVKTNKMFAIQARAFREIAVATISGLADKNPAAFIAKVKEIAQRAANQGG